MNDADFVDPGDGSEALELEDDLRDDEDEDKESEDSEALDSYDGQDRDEEEEEEEEEGTHIVGLYNADDVNDQVFEELHLPADIVEDVVGVWDAFLRTCGTRDTAGEALFAAVYDAAPSLQPLFTLPRAVMAMRFVNALQTLVTNITEPMSMKAAVETLGFQHLQLEVTIPQVVIFRDAIVDLFQVELGRVLTSNGAFGWRTLINYVGGAFIFIRQKFSERLRILASSWATANNRAYDENGEEIAVNHENEDWGEGDRNVEKENNAAEESKRRGFKLAYRGSPKKEGAKGMEEGSPSASGEADLDGMSGGAVPQTFREMFLFNAVVMGVNKNVWMREVLDSFDSIVKFISCAGRLQEECDVVSLRIAKHSTKINLAEFKAVMLASLRSLVPKDWDSQHELAWSWLWENVERMIKTNSGKPAMQEKALTKFLLSMEEDSKKSMRDEIYSRLFSLAPQAEQFFTSSITRLHFICDKIIAMTLDLYRDPNKTAETISATGLRHVGYGVPTDIFGPFVTAFCHVVCSYTDDEVAKEGFRWSLGLICRIITRVISEGSTIVMKAINQNSAKQLRKAAGCAPRGKRSMWMLSVQAGTQSISPLLWAIETSALEAAKAIIVDLLTIRADRDRYYYGMDDLFERHPDIVKRLMQIAPGLMETLFDGLIWRSRNVEGGMRRVNYFIKHLVVANGQFSKSIEWIIQTGDLKVVCHPLVAVVVDTIWTGIAFRSFLGRKLWLVLTLVIFVLGVSAFDAETDRAYERYAVALCRLFTYLFSLVPRIYTHVTRTCRDYKNKDTVKLGNLPVPRYLNNWQDRVCLLLALTLLPMMVLEPILACLAEHTENRAVLTQICPGSESMRFAYSVLTMIATLLYFLLVVDLAVFSTRVSAFVLICFRVVNEACLYIFAMFFVIVTFSCGIPSLRHSNADFMTISQSASSLANLALLMFNIDRYEALVDEPVLMATVIMYMIITAVFLVNLLVAQLNCAYQCMFQDMVGYARLNRGKIVVESMATVSKARWDAFVESLRLDEPCRFGEGDRGMSGGVQMWEPANNHVVAVDMIKRFGGTTAEEAQWPDEEKEEEGDRFGHMERMLEKAIRRMPKGQKKRGPNGSSALGSMLDMSSELDTKSARSENASD